MVTAIDHSNWLGSQFPKSNSTHFSKRYSISVLTASPIHSTSQAVARRKWTLQNYNFCCSHMCANNRNFRLESILPEFLHSFFLTLTFPLYHGFISKTNSIKGHAKLHNVARVVVLLQRTRNHLHHYAALYQAFKIKFGCSFALHSCWRKCKYWHKLFFIALFPLQGTSLKPNRDKCFGI